MADKTLSVSATTTQIELREAPHELVVFLAPRPVGFAEFRGSRVDIEAERVVPQDLKWPTGAGVASWRSGGLSFALRRTPPKKLKGSKDLWLEADWWSLTWELTNGPSFGEREIAQKSAELAEAFVRYSPQGQAKFRALIDRCAVADLDTRFQAFKAIFIPDGKKLGRRSKASALTSDAA